MRAPTVAQLRSALANATTAEEVEEIAALIESELSYIELLPHQQPPETPWAVWLLLAGRGSGKSLAGATELNAHALGPACDRRLPGGHRMGIVAPTHGDVVQSAWEPPSGVRAVNRDVRLLHRDGRLVLVWPNNAEAHLMGASTPEDAERPRAVGNRCLDWYEEFAAWRYLDNPHRTGAGESRAQVSSLWDNLQMGLRAGPTPKILITTTPKNRQRLRSLIQAGERWEAAGSPSDALRLDRVAVSRARMDANPWLSDDFRAEMLERYKGTRLERQELFGEVLDEVGDYFDVTQLVYLDTPAFYGRSIRFWDLAASASETADWTVGCRVSTSDRLTRACVEDVVRVRRRPGELEELILSTAARDGKGVAVGIEEEGGASGKMAASALKYALANLGVSARSYRPTGAKTERARIAATLIEQGRVDCVRANWTDAFTDELAEFPEGTHDDQVDAFAGAIGVLWGRFRKRGRAVRVAGDVEPSYWRMGGG